MSRRHPVTCLQVGDRGPQVRGVRQQLRHVGILGQHRNGEPEETFDVDVDRAVRTFQQRYGLLVDGRVGPQTSRALDAARWSLGDRILRHTPGHLMHGDDVAELQERLMLLGLFSGRADGLLGPATEAALAELQRGVGLTPDGTCGPDTLWALAGVSRRVPDAGDAYALREWTGVTQVGPSLAGRVVVLDPATEDDSSAQGHGLHGWQVAFDLARRMEGRLAAMGVTAVLTRSPTGRPTLDERVALATEVRADLLVSVHCEAQPSSSAQGTATYFWGNDRVVGGRSVVGERLADLIRREIVARTDLLDCRSHARTWDLLRCTPMPAVQVDCGYLSNPADARRLADADLRDALAEAVVAGIQRLYLPAGDQQPTGTLRVAEVLASRVIAG